MVAYAKRQKTAEKKTLRKHPSMFRWLTKISFVAAEYQTIVNVLTTPTLSALFGDSVPIRRLNNASKTKSYVKALAADDIKETLSLFGHTRDNFGNDKDGPDQFDAFVAEIQAAASKRAPVIHDFYQVQSIDWPLAETTKRVHCECALLCHLGQLGLPMLPYIGVSKLSCAFCDLYFAAYRAQMKVEVYTHGTHGQATVWMCPDFPGDAEVKDDFCKKLWKYIEIRLEEETSLRRASMHSQSTTASGDSGKVSFISIRSLD